MPQINGLRAEILHQVVPNIPIILLTVYKDLIPFAWPTQLVLPRSCQRQINSICSVTRSKDSLIGRINQSKVVAVFAKPVALHRWVLPSVNTYRIGFACGFGLTTVGNYLMSEYNINVSIQLQEAISPARGILREIGACNEPPQTDSPIL